jgi:hypothetical protein
MTEWRQIRDSRYVVSPEGKVRKIGKGRGTTVGHGQEVRGKIGPKDLKRLLVGNRPAVFININPEDLMNGKAKWWGTAALVLEAYVGERQGTWVPKWKNGERSDCRVENLSWGYREGPGVHVPWTYRPKGFLWDYSSGNPKLKQGVIGHLRRLRKEGVNVLAYRFDIPPMTVARVLAGKYDVQASEDAGYLVTGHINFSPIMLRGEYQV